MSKTQDKLDNIVTQCSELQHRMDIFDAVIAVREPGTLQSAESYDGLRRAIIGERQAFTQSMAMAARIDAAIEQGATIESVRSVVRDVINELGITKITTTVDAPAEQLFHWFDGADAGATNVVLPAYISAEGAIVRKGVLANEKAPTTPQLDALTPSTGTSYGDAS